MSSIITDIGVSKLAAATPQAQLQITHIAVGDGNGATPTLSSSMTALAREVWRGGASDPIQGSADNVIIFEGYIPGSVGPFDIREVAVFDIDGDMIAIGTTTLIEKPDPAGGSSIALSVRLHIQVESASTVNLIVQDQGITDHQGLANRGAANAHTAESISVSALTGLETNADDLQGVLAALGNAARLTKQSSPTDTTAGRALLVGAFGLGASESISVPNDDLNDITKNGFYNANATHANLPDSSGGDLIHINGELDNSTQIMGSVNKEDLWFRIKKFDTWGVWKKLLKYGDYGIGKPIALTVSDDLNSIKSPGIYQNTTGSNTTDNNYPTQEAGSLQVFRTNESTAVCQIYYGYVTNSIHTRHFNGTAWSSWREGLNVGDYGIGKVYSSFDLTDPTVYENDGLTAQRSGFQKGVEAGYPFASNWWSSIKLPSGFSGYKPVIACNLGDLFLGTSSTTDGTNEGVLWRKFYNDANLGTGLVSSSKQDKSKPIFTSAGDSQQSFSVRIGSKIVLCPSGSSIALPTLQAAKDYKIYLKSDATLVAQLFDDAAPANSAEVGGFHCAFSNGAIVPESIWDFGWRPACNPRGMVLSPDKRVWVDIYLAHVDYAFDGYSRSDGQLAGNASPAKIPAMYGGDGTATKSMTYFAVMDLASSQQKRLPTYDEFVVYAYGVVEGYETNSNSYFAQNRSACGVEQATGYRKQWGLNNILLPGASNIERGTEGRGGTWSTDLPLGYAFGGNSGASYTAGSRAVEALRVDFTAVARFVCEHQMG